MNILPSPNTIRLTLYGRSYCHLCEEMRAALQAMRPGLAFEVDMVDVDQDPQLEARYGQWVPVLVHGETRICHYRLDAARLTAHLKAFR